MNRNMEIKTFPFKILQLTDLHLGFGPLSKGQDEKTKQGIMKIVNQANPDLIVLTGDLIYPFLPKTGTLNNLKQAKALTKFFDSFKIPYALIFGNHDVEMGSKGSKEELADIYRTSQYGIFENGPDITGVGNYIIELKHQGKLHYSLGLLDSNMYGDGWFFSGFDYIHDDQVEWLVDALDTLKQKSPDMKSLLFYHMPLVEFKEAYEKMKLGDQSVKYHFGSVHEKNEYFGISKYRSKLFDAALSLECVKGMFCGHDHLNTLSLTYKGIQITYGMSMDHLAYKNINKYHIQRGGNLIELHENGDLSVKMIPLDKVVSKFVRGQDK